MNILSYLTGGQAVRSERAQLEAMLERNAAAVQQMQKTIEQARPVMNRAVPDRDGERENGK